ncbi:MAG TPA: hypothetical protein VFZ66_12985 [Herpetosiphonaceae bacterium]
MWFKVLSLLIALLCLGKAGTALLIPQTFYRRRRQQYASTRIPLSVLIPPALILVLAGLAWYATIAHYVAWSWLVTGFLTPIALLGVVNLLRWPQHRRRLQAAITEAQAAQLRRADLAILGLSALFGLLGVMVF